MDVPLVLSHRTAWLYHNLVSKPHDRPLSVDDKPSDESAHLDEEDSGSEPLPDIGLGKAGCKASKVAQYVRSFLLDIGLTEEEAVRIDILCGHAFERSGSEFFRSHVFGTLMPTDHLVEIAQGLFVVDETICFVQSGTWMSELEQIEYGFEICGLYRRAIGDGGYRPCGPRSSVGEIRQYCEGHQGLRGVSRAKRLLCNVKDKARSPMETATAMMIVLRRSLGGLGCKNIELNHRVDIPTAYRHLTKSDHFDIDIFALTSGLGIEYNGEDHLTRKQSAHDAERSAVLWAMGIDEIVLTGSQFAEQLALHRAMNAIAEALRLKSDRSASFQRAQNELRKFVIRSWAGDELACESGSSS